MTDTATAVEEREATASRSPGTANIIVKVILVGLVDALLIICFVQSLSAQWWLAVGFFAVTFVAVNYVYFTKKNLPLKYLLPGLVFLIVFQLYIMVFTFYTSFTNYGTGHLGDKASSIVAVQQANVVAVEGGKTFDVVPVVKGSTVSMLLTDPTTGKTQLGTNEGITDVPEGDVEKNGAKVTGLNGYTSLNLAALSGNADYKAQWDALRPPLDKEAGTYIRATSVSKASEAKSGFTYNAENDTMTSADGKVYHADDNTGQFVDDSGQALQPGWVINVGFKNYASLLTDQSIRDRFIPIMAWTFAFAILTTVLNFGVGLLLALTLQDSRMRGQSIYRFILIIPYGLPVILMAPLWKGLLNTDFGLINQILGVNIAWLDDAWLARFSVLMVNLWMGFPYFFLVCSGALTTVPADLKEAAYVDGAPGRYAFRTIVFPLLLVATAPLLVTTFAFNFNNYTLIQMLTAGGPFPGSVSEGGSTDLLINYVMRIAFTPSQQQLGLASAIAMVIFVIVGGVSSYGFRLTRKLEEIRQ